jgi:phosphatidylglycerophosphatase GEP4
MLLDKWRSAVEGPILGPLVDENGEPVRPNERSEKEDRWERDGVEGKEGGQRHLPDVPRKRGDAEVTLRKGRDDVPKDKAGGEREINEGTSGIGHNAVESSQPLKIIVVGDRLFTDTLLAHRLRLHMTRDASSQDVISIATTQLPRPNDVRLLRWIENVLSRRRVREGPTDWGRYILRHEPETAVTPEGLRARIWRRLVPVWLREPSPMTRHPRSWPVPVLLGTARGVVRTTAFIFRYTMVGARWIWARAKRRIEQRRTGAKVAVVAPEVEQTKAKIA